MKYSNLSELRKKKELLKKEVDGMQEILTFKNPKSSLSYFTNGATDSFLSEKETEDGPKISLNTGNLVKSLSKSVKHKLTDNSGIISIDNAGLKESVVENALKLGVVSLVGNYTKKKLYNTSWKNKLVGLAIVYVLPIVLKFVREKLEQRQRKS